MKDRDNLPTIEQWAGLYESAENIMKLAPWEFLWDTDLLTIMLPGRDEPVCCSVMGRVGKCYAIGVYPGFESVVSFYRIAEASEYSPQFIAGLEQNCMICNFGDREELSEEDREVIKSLGLRFRGKNRWIYFRSMEPGLYPWHLNAEQAGLLLQTLQNLEEIIKHLKREDVKVDFDGNETLMRYYSPEDGAWFNKVVEMPQILMLKRTLVVDDETLIAKLKKKKRSGACLEFDAVYLPTPVRDSKGERPYFPRFVLLADKKNELVLDQHMAEQDEGIEAVILEMMTRYIMKYGRPASIYARDDRFVSYIGDLCKKLSIKLIEGEGVPAVDRLLEDLLRTMI